MDLYGAPILRSISAYGLTGAVGTATHFAVLYTTVNYFGPLIASTTGAVIGALINYQLARQIVFASEAPIGRSLPRFLVVATIGILLNAILIATLISRFPLAIAQGLATTSVFILSFIVNGAWTFDEKP